MKSIYNIAGKWKCPGHPFLNFLEPPLQILKSYAKPDEVIYGVRVLHSTSAQINQVKEQCHQLTLRTISLKSYRNCRYYGLLSAIWIRHNLLFKKEKKTKNKNSHPIMSLLIPPSIHKFITYGGMQTTDKIVIIIIIIIIPGDLPAFKLSINFSRAHMMYEHYVTGNNKENNNNCNNNNNNNNSSSKPL